MTAESNTGGLLQYHSETESFTRYQYNPDVPGSLPNNDLYELYEDKEGHLWMGDKEGRLIHFDKKTQVFNSFDMPTLGDPAGYLEDVVQDQTGTLWLIALGDYGVFTFEAETASFSRVELQDTSSQAPYTGNFWSLHEDQDGMLWFGGERVLIRYHPLTGEVNQFDMPFENSENTPTTFAEEIHEDAQGNLWIAGPNSALVFFNKEEETFSFFYPSPDKEVDLSFPYTLFVDRQDIIWVSYISPVSTGREGGLYRVVESADAFDFTPVKLDYIPDLPTKGIWDFHEDADGILWLATMGGGIQRLDPKTGQVTPYNTEPAQPTFKSDLSTVAMIPRDSTSFWVGGFFPGLRIYDKNTHALIYRSEELDRINALIQAGVTSLLEDTYGYLWIGTWRKGAIRYHPTTKEITHFQHEPGNPNSLIGYRVYDIFEGRLGDVWLGSSIEDLTARSGALHRFDYDTQSFERFSQFGQSGIYDGLSSRTWIGSTSLGIFELDSLGTITRHYTVEDGLPSNRVRFGVEDLNHTLWFSTQRSLARLDPTSGAVKTLNYPLAQHNISSLFTAFRAKNGTIYFASDTGLLSFEPEQLDLNEYAPNAVLVDVHVQNEPVLLGAEAPLNESITEASNMTLSHKQNEFSISYAGLHFENPSKNTYRYKLEPHQGNWVEAGFERRAHYFDVPPGNYTFHVMASNPAGILSAPRSLDITILPPWWQTSFAFVVYGLSFVVGFIAIDRFRRQRLIARERQQAQIKEAKLETQAAQALSREATAMARESEAQAKALEEENKRKQLEIEKGKELEKSYRELQQALAHLRETQDQLVHTEKLASLGQLTAGIAHEIKNPLNFVNNFSRLSKDIMEELEEWIQEHNIQPDEDLEDIIGTLKMNVAKIHHHGNRADGIVRSMLEHSRTEPGQQRAADVNKLLDEYVNLAFHSWQATHEEKHVPKVTREYDGSIGEINLIPQNIGRVLINLLDNAFYAVGEKSEALSPEPEGLQAKHPADFEPRTSDYLPEVKVSTSRDAEYIEIRIQDNGVGIPKDIQSKIFEPFFTTKPTGSGTGLGLSLSYDIVVQGHGGELSVESEEGAGAAFIMVLPLNN